MQDTEFNGDREMLARSRIMELWKPGDLFHNFSRYSWRPPWTDRLSNILKKGLVPPALDTSGTVVTDCGVDVKGGKYKYDELVFLHRFDSGSEVYIPNRTETISCLINPQTPFLTEKDMGEHWKMLSKDEVYVPRIIKPEELIGFAVDERELEKIFNEFGKDFKQLGLPLYDFKGKIFWPT